MLHKIENRLVSGAPFKRNLSSTFADYVFSRTYVLFVSGDISKDSRFKDLLGILSKEAVRDSGFSGKILRILSEHGLQSLALKMILHRPNSLQRVYLTEKTELEDISRKKRESRPKDKRYE